MGPCFRGDNNRFLGELPLSPRRAPPVLQRRPDTARQAEAVDRGRASQRLEAVQLDAAPLEAAFLQDIARGRIGDAGARNQVLGIEFLEEEIDHRARGFGAETLAPMRDAKPIAEFRRVRRAAVDADHADGRIILFDQKHSYVVVGGFLAHEYNSVVMKYM